MTKPAIEFIQLIVLARICLEFRKIVFQGGTAIRWGYGGTRFSEKKLKNSVRYENHRDSLFFAIFV